MFQEYGRAKIWSLIALGALLLILGYVTVSRLLAPAFHGAAPDQPAIPLIAPVAQPPLAAYEDVAQYTEGKPLPSAPAADVILDTEDADGHVRGDPATSVRMVEYAGLSSTYTQVMHEELIAFLERNKDRMHWELRHYPKTNNENDYRAGMAAECLYAQLGDEIFWRYVDSLLYDIGSTLPLSDLLAKAEDLGADTALLASCIESREYMNAILGDKATAQVDSKIYVAPAFLFKNLRTGALRVVEGANTTEYMQAVLDQVAGEYDPSR